MDYAEIDRIMVQKSLATDPAFEDLRIAIQPTPKLDGCPLGLYFPDTSTITLPPDATQGALLHELGHRHGHYYYDDLSEQYAESFRKRYQKGKALLYLGNDFARLPQFGSLFEEGEKGAVEIALLQPLTPDQLYEIKSQLYSYGKRPKVYYGNSEVPWVRIEFVKGVDWLVIIGATVGGLALLTIGSIGYAIYKWTTATPWVVPMALAGFGTFLFLKFAAKQVEKRTGKKWDRFIEEEWRWGKG